MKTITEDYVSFETAKLLREKGFKESTLAYTYNQDMVAYYSQPRVTDDYTVEAGRYPLPTLQMAMKWLREVHNIFIEPKMSKNTFLWGYRVSISNGSTVCLHAKIFNKCEEACEASIKYCLENLI